VNLYATQDRTGFRRTAASRAGGSGKLGLPFVLVFAALSFNFFLCFVNTNVVGISVTHVMAAEMLIIGLTLLACYRSIGQNEIILICGMFLYLMVLSTVRAMGSFDSGFDVKIIRDFLIPVAFFLLGTRISSLASADSIVKICAVVVTALAIFEYFFLDLFLRYFNVIAYYVARGTVDLDQTKWLLNTLFVSGFRPEGRTLLPFLGDHRVSSIFLEPVSPGNFAVTLFFWALVRSYFERKIYSGIFLMAIFLTVMADNRFGAYLIAAAFGLSLLPAQYLRAAMIVAPFVAILALVGVGHAYPDAPLDNSMWGRFLSSGNSLASFDVWNWLGVGHTIDDWDSGYTYTISRIGIVGFAAFWALFMTLKGANAQFQMFRAFCALYFATILCVSYSLYTIKTASLLWFLLGALSVLGGRSRVSAFAPVTVRTAAVPRDFETTPSR
jgi:putative polymerase